MDLTGDNIIRQQMDGGPARQRRRYSMLPFTQSCQLVLTDAQALALIQFMDDVGACVFDVVSTVSDLSFTFRFLQFPKFTTLCGGQTYNVDDPENQPADSLQRKHSVTFTLERV